MDAYTPKQGRGRTRAEIEWGVRSRPCMDARIPDRETLAAQTQAWQRDRNNLNVVVNRQFTTKNARVKLRRLYPADSELTEHWSGLRIAVAKWTEPRPLPFTSQGNVKGQGVGSTCGHAIQQSANRSNPQMSLP